MGVLGAIRVDGLIDQVLSKRSNADYQKNIIKLQKIAKTAIPKLATRLETLSKEEATPVVDLLSNLARTDYAEYFRPLFSDPSSYVRDGVVKALSQSNHIDPNVFVDLFEDQDASKPMLMIFLTAQKQKVNGSKLLR